MSLLTVALGLRLEFKHLMIINYQMKLQDRYLCSRVNDVRFNFKNTGLFKINN